MINKNALTGLKVFGLVAVFALASGCATNASVEDVERAQSDAQEALDIAREAQRTAQEALEAATSAQSAADDAKACCEEQRQRLDRAQERNQRK
ncbi:Lpp/OprI family alanine-zipper lipoprotein [Marinimicrobium sp. ABcell2]|uniref:Lpp/OprI family alanine-zipper lipoprotein n=1 Tax=Marinimicrobium sp. ABcell2 TaxID=3069751 RepID=UPI0027B01DA2|nr:Lpp/OprI family alanine-zipper lipoprotein [Marinimicrobium sp. ABcell2]MDQ2076547.1 Lpp/OprI family alanine-zipper lipoprotein [Marinimicrobium sp. ABcell2]